MIKRRPVLHTVICKFTPVTLVAMVIGALLLSLMSGSMAATSAPDDASDIGLTIPSKELLDGIPVGPGATAFHVHGNLRAADGAKGDGVYQEVFRVNSGAADSIVAASELEKIGIERAGQTSCTLPDGTPGECSFGYARIEFLGEMKQGRVIFGPEDAKPTLGLSALSAIGFTVDSETQTIKAISATGAAE